MPTRYRDDPEAAPRSRSRTLARAMRRQPTEAEKRLWWHLRKRIPLNGSSFRRQVPLGPYIVDFCCLKARLVIEVDGGQHTTDEALAYDAARTRTLEAQGYQVIRFPNSEVLTAIDDVMATIYARLAERCPELLT
ncbi:endonuclease domain-containing protein [Salinarimonas ramus]|uniref:Endonuclease n=1 Tax=Salinarimonas ramus TaxID=690164 RepID=A0A917Q599_9HYPH|nr:endonuclease domain-containing protein [Salinarimonas ramus]GGK28108.1 endonuclease [Salinarimonas ramus]